MPSELADMSIDEIPNYEVTTPARVPWSHPRLAGHNLEFVFREEDSDGNFQFVTRTAKEVFSGKTLALICVPGAFTPTCSDLQLPDYEAAYDDFIKKGVDEIYCLSVNDAFVMNAWFEKLGIKKVKALPDGNGTFSWAVNLMVGKQNLGFGNRCWRSVAIVDDGIFVNLIEEKGKSANCDTDPYERTKPKNLLALIGNN